MNVFWMIVAAFFLGAGSVLFLCGRALRRMRRKLRELRESDERRLSSGGLADQLFDA